MRLQISPEGERVLDAWLDRNPPKPDRELVAEVVRTVASGEWSGRWFHYADVSNSSIEVIEPRDGLTIHVHIWEVDAQFDVVRIFDEERPTDDDQ